MIGGNHEVSTVKSVPCSRYREVGTVKSVPCGRYCNVGTVIGVFLKKKYTIQISYSFRIRFLVKICNIVYGEYLWVDGVRNLHWFSYFPVLQ